MLPGDDHRRADEALRYGVLYIYEIHNRVSSSKFRCSACFDFASIDSAVSFVDLQKAQDKTSDAEDLMINDLNAVQYENFAYTGDIRLGKSCVFITLSHDDSDRALMVFSRGKESRKFRGALGTVNFASIGEAPRPVTQNIGISSEPVMLSGEEIEECLLMDCPEIICGDEADELIELLKDLYSSGADSLAALNERRKKAIVKSEIQYLVNGLMRKNLRRCSKIDQSEDERWLEKIKDSDGLSDY